MVRQNKMKTICIDIDGTISHFIEWQGPKVFGTVLHGASENIHRLKESGYFIIIYTTRADKNAIADFLRKNNIPFDAINENPLQPENAIGGKPIADVYLDDRNVPFTGDWDKAYEDVIAFEPWEQKIINMEEYQKQFMSDDFTQSMEMLRHYDNNNWEITKFVVSEMLLAVGACWTLYTLSVPSDTSSKPLLSNSQLLLIAFIICFGSTLFGILSLCLVGKNRAYFAKTARHINNYRNHALSNSPLGFQLASDFWSDPSYPNTMSWKSTHLLCFYLIIAFTAIMGFTTTYLLTMIFGYDYYWPSIIIGIVLIVAPLIIAFNSLAEPKKK